MTDVAGAVPIPPHRAGGGIFIIKGSSLRISDLSISIGEDASVSGNLSTNLALNVFPYWLEIAQEHLRTAEGAASAVRDAWQGTDDTVLVAAMERECRASMQVIVSSAIAMDAFYAFLRRHVPVPAETIQAWRANRTARHKQVAETLRRGIRVGPESMNRIGGVLRELFKYRDMAVHPKAGFASPAWYPELNFSTEWRFVAFRKHNAQALCATTLSIIAQCVARPKTELTELVQFCEPASLQVMPMLASWEERYGPLFERNGE